jgi:hypothetical protein
MKRMVIAAALALCGCSRSDVTIHNDGTTRVSDVFLSVAGNDLRIGEISPGDSQRIRYKPHTEDKLQMEFIVNGVERRCVSNAYISPPFNDQFTIHIASDGKCSISRFNLK